MPTHPDPSWRRQRRLIKPGLQARLVLAFGGVSLLALSVQFLLFLFLSMRLANRLPSGGDELVNAMPWLLATALGCSLAVLFPATVVVGLAVTFRVAGPLWRFEHYLAAVARGERPEGPCRIRDGDELRELCDAINGALDQTRRAALAEGAVGSAGSDEPPTRAA